MDNVKTSTDAIADLFDLDAQVVALHDLPSGMDSADCTNDTCTDGCR